MTLVDLSHVEYQGETFCCPGCSAFVTVLLALPGGRLVCRSCARSLLNGRSKTPPAAPKRGGILTGK